MGSCDSCHKTKKTLTRNNSLVINPNPLTQFKLSTKLKALNPILQCLIHIKPFVSYFKKKFDKAKTRQTYLSFHNSGKCLSDSFNFLIDEIILGKSAKIRDSNKSNEGIIAFEKMIFKIEPNYNENQELLLNFILMRLHKELNKADNITDLTINYENTNKSVAFKSYMQYFQCNAQSIISDLFFGAYYIQTFCCKCQCIFYSFQPYIYGHYPLNDVFQYKFQTLNMGKNELYVNKTFNAFEININDCLYYDKQMRNKIQRCNNCLNMAPCNYQSIIYYAPKILSFVFNNNLNMPNVKFLIEEKININFFSEIKMNINYNLIGIIINDQPDHYIAYRKSTMNDKWYRYNDTIIDIKNNLNEILMSNKIPYILFYENTDSNK